MTSNNLCNSCTNIGCEFQSGVVRTKCAFYMPPHIETDNCGNYIVTQPTRKLDETVKLLIEIPKAEYELIVGDEACGLNPLTRAIAHGIPLDSNSDRAEVQAYFDGQAYGWEEGRKALIDDVKAEIEKHQLSREYCSEHNIDTAIDMGMVRIILDNIGKESEVAG